jgi:histidinol-phosphate aminotransferase
MGSVRLRRDIAAVPAYVAGKSARAVDGRPAYKLSSNELPWGPDQAVVDAVAAAALLAHRYPSAIGAGLTSALAQRLSVPAERIVVGGGSISLVQLLGQSVADPGDAVVFAWRSYEAYPIVIPVCHAMPVPVPLAGFRHDLAAMADAVRRTHARMVIVCSPNNPTGTAMSASDLDEFIGVVPPDCLVVLDEAYHEFNDDLDAPDGIALAQQHPNVAVLRTFSKAFGLAGMRVGYCVAPDHVADAMRRVGLPFPVSAVAEAAAVAALEAWPRQRERVAQLIERRSVFTAAMCAAGFEIPESRANFVWVPLGDESSDLDEALREAGISVRTFPGEGVRITIGEPEALDAVLDVARAWRLAHARR